MIVKTNHQPKNVLLLACISPLFIGSYYHKAFRDMGFNVLCVSKHGQVWLDHPFSWEHLFYHLRKVQFWPDFIFIIEGYEGLQFDYHLTDKINIPSAYLSVDTALRYDIHLKITRHIEHVFTTQKPYVERFKRDGRPNVHWLPFCCDPDVHHPYQSEQPYDVVFAGNTVPEELYKERIAILSELQKRFRFAQSDQVYWNDMSILYSQSKMVFNHCSLAPAYNARIFEALGCCRLLLNNPVDNGLCELLEPGSHFVVYENREQLIELVSYYLTHTDKAAKIALAGQTEVYQHHTYRHRIAKILKVLFPTISFLSKLK